MTEHERMLITKYDLLFESRLTKVESTMEHMNKSMEENNKNINENFKEIKSDLRWLLGIMLTFSSILLGLMAKGFDWY